VGAIALAFLIIGYQAALVVSRASRLRIEANRDRPDTVFVFLNGAATMPETLRRNAPHSRYVQQVRRATRGVECFLFNPNTVSVEDLIRLGFSEKQAQAIDNYRTKGGRFRRKSDFAKSFVVADSVYRRLEPYIYIPRLDLNAADSAALDALPGIGPFYAARIVSYRAELGGYSFPEQLMDIYHFDQEKYDGLKDLVFCSRPAPYALWTLPADSLRRHPYIRSWQAARAIVLFRDNTPREGWTVEAIAAAGILPEEDARRLARCVIAGP
jgi:DNA uptake protein ComE-like DNA-binding protein